MRRLLLSGLAVALVFVPFHLHLAVERDVWDTGLFWLGLVLFGLSVVVMLLGTRGWSWRSVGLFWICAGLTVLFGRTISLRQGWLAPPVEWLADVFRATLVVGGTLTLVSLLDWLADWGRERRAAAGQGDG